MTSRLPAAATAAATTTTTTRPSARNFNPASQFTMSSSTDQPVVRTGKSSHSKRTSTREKIERMVAEGTSNYPAYLKLIYTGDSEEPSSSEDELCLDPTAAQFGNTHVTRAPRAVVAALHGREDAVNAAGGRPTHQQDHSDLTSYNSRQCSATESDKLADLNREKLTSTPTDDRQASILHCPHRTAEDDVINSSGLPDTDSYSRPPDGNTSLSDQAQLHQAQLRLQLNKLQDDIVTLKSVLNSKLSQAACLRQKLGLTTMAELRHSLQTLKGSGTFQKTNAAFKSFSVFAFQKIGNFRESVAFKSVGEKVGSLRTSRSMGNIKSRLTSLTTSRSENNVSAAAVSATVNPRSPYTVGDEDSDEDYDHN